MNEMTCHIPGVRIYQPDIFEDSRGVFSSIDASDMRITSLVSSMSKHGVLRGLHYQDPPQTKFVWVTQGQIRDVIVDLRSDSPAYRRHIVLHLSADNRFAVYIPGGCAHGYAVVDGPAQVMYAIGGHYSARGQRGIRWDDPSLGIDWGIENPIMSDRDKAFLTL